MNPNEHRRHSEFETLVMAGLASLVVILSFLFYYYVPDLQQICVKVIDIAGSGMSMLLAIYFKKKEKKVPTVVSFVLSMFLLLLAVLEFVMVGYGK